MPKEKLPPSEVWIEEQFDKIPNDAFETAGDRLFADERGCQAVFVALWAIHDLAEENGDESMMDSCQEVMRGLALSRLSHLGEL